MKKKISGMRVFGTIFLIICCILSAIPIALGIARSLFVDSAFQTFNYFKSYLTVFKSDYVLSSFLRSGLIVIFSVPSTVIIVILAAYGFSKFKFKGQNFIYIMLLSALMIPSATVMYPCFKIVRDLGIINKVPSVILTEIAYAIPLNLLMIKNFFDDIPNDLLEAAQIDGASSFRILWQIVVPIAKPAISVITLWCFGGSWNDYLWPMLFFSDSSKKTVTLLPQYFMGTYQQHYDEIFAALIIIMIPTVIVYLTMQKYFDQGIISGAVKG